MAFLLIVFANILPPESSIPSSQFANQHYETKFANELILRKDLKSSIGRLSKYFSSPRDGTLVNDIPQCNGELLHDGEENENHEGIRTIIDASDLSLILLDTHISTNQALRLLQTAFPPGLISAYTLNLEDTTLRTDQIHTGCSETSVSCNPFSAKEYSEAPDKVNSRLAAYPTAEDIIMLAGRLAGATVETDQLMINPNSNLFQEKATFMLCSSELVLFKLWK
ncbi:unnamed protein product [Protopolystoma xenopodis]|uniref:Uncharacterized protein n=1 Tax=Protopolystoma xenopodis TaxID=117903 RepID=A0A3S5A0X0_9PLAT|nr:unnamed protein product [Protopolystoma xenopodis]